MVSVIECVDKCINDALDRRGGILMYKDRALWEQNSGISPVASDGNSAGGEMYLCRGIPRREDCVCQWESC